MLIAKGRLDPGTEALEFMQLVLAARQLRVLEISPEIAVLSASRELVGTADPADRIIAATTLAHKAQLVTSDGELAKVQGLSVVW